MANTIGAGSSGLVVPFPRIVHAQVGFAREELQRILGLYGRMVAAGQWRDYAMDFTREVAVFAAFRGTADPPQTRIEKWHALRGRQEIGTASCAEEWCQYR